MVPQTLRDEVMEELLGGVMSGHLEESKTLEQFKRRFDWPGHSFDVKNCCQTCSTCTSCKIAMPENCAPLQTIKAGSPMQVIAVNIMGPLPESNSYQEFLYICCRRLLHILDGSFCYS